MPSGIDGEGVHPHPNTLSPLPPSPGKGDMMLKVQRTFTAWWKMQPVF